MRPELTSVSHLRVCFKEEADLLAQFQHPNIVTLLENRIYRDQETGNFQLYFVMEYIAGEPLDHWLRRARPIGIKVIEEIMRGVGRGVAAMHAKGITHGDVSPSNIMISGSPGEFSIKLIDLGLAKQAGTPSARRGKGGGTPGFLSPEHLGLGELNEFSDLFSLGALLYYLYFGRRAYLGEDYQTIHAAFLRGECPEVPRATEAPIRTILNRALNLDPARRYPTVKPFLEEINRFSDNHPVNALRLLSFVRL
jgi:serine/threonine-protein kinase